MAASARMRREWQCRNGFFCGHCLFGVGSKHLHVLNRRRRKRDVIEIPDESGAAPAVGDMCHSSPTRIEVESFLFVAVYMKGTLVVRALFFVSDNGAAACVQMIQIHSTALIADLHPPLPFPFRPPLK